MKLKTWQKWGLVFGIVHIIVALVFLFLYVKYPDGCPPIIIILYFIDFPISIMGEKILTFFMPYSGNSVFIPYLIIAGTVFYSCIGIIIGKIINKRRSKNTI